jgi:hypothetical protein
MAYGMESSFLVVGFFRSIPTWTWTWTVYTLYNIYTVCIGVSSIRAQIEFRTLAEEERKINILALLVLVPSALNTSTVPTNRTVPHAFCCSSLHITYVQPTFLKIWLEKLPGRFLGRNNNTHVSLFVRQQHVRTGIIPNTVLGSTSVVTIIGHPLTLCWHHRRHKIAFHSIGELHKTHSID